MVTGTNEHDISALTLDFPQSAHIEYLWVLYVYRDKQLPVSISINNRNILFFHWRCIVRVSCVSS